MLFCHTQTHHQALQHFGFQLGICRARLPAGFILAFGGVQLDHAPMADIDFRRARRAALFQAGAEFIAFGSGIQEIQRLADGAANDVHGQLGAVFVPVGFHDAGGGHFGGQGKADAKPEILQRIPVFIRGAGSHQPALVAIALDADGIDLRQYTDILARLQAALVAVFRERGRGLAVIRNGIALIPRR